MAYHHRHRPSTVLNTNIVGCCGRRLVSVGLLLTLFAYSTWQLQYALPAYLVRLYPEWLDAQIREDPVSDDSNITMHIRNVMNAFETVCNHNDTIVMDPRNISPILQERLTAFFTPPSHVENLVEGKDRVMPCRRTFLDLGANIGDSLGKFIDAGFPSKCQGFEQIKRRPHYNISRGIVELGAYKENDLTNFVQRCLKESSTHPEEYCYVGVEGNPVFQTRLQELEARIMGTTPRPLRSVHFYTKTVAAGGDGPTVLYLDTINAKNNFWGSSIVAAHKDAKASAVRNNNVTVQASVMGLTLSTLLKRSVRIEPGAHVLIKIDIEGGEYPVMNEAIHTLCDLTSAGVRVDMILETHDLDVMGEETPAMKLFFIETQPKLKACNIQQGDLSARDGQR